jgi:hypothetical protein
MALTFGRRRAGPTAMPMPRRDLDMAMRASLEPTGPRDDDYLIEDGQGPARASVMSRVVRLLQIVLTAILAVLSFAIFWLLGMMLNIL